MGVYKYDSLQYRVCRALTELDRELAVSLLLIRHASQRTPTLWDNIEKKRELSWNDLRREIVYSLLRITLPVHLLDLLRKAISCAGANESVMREAIWLLSKPPMESADLSTLYESIAVPGTASPGKRVFYTPKDTVQLLLQMLNIQGGTIYDPCCGSGAMLQAAAQICGDSAVRLYGQAMDDDSYDSCGIDLFFRNMQADMGTAPANTLMTDLHRDKQFQYVIANPPFNAKNWYTDQTFCKIAYDKRWRYGLPPKSNANYAWLQHIIGHLETKGAALVLLPNGSLTSRNAKEQAIRERILRDGLVEMIIAFPAGLFRRTKVPFCAWFISKKSRKTADVLLVDASKMKLSPEHDLQEQDRKALMTIIDRYRRGELEKVSDWHAIASLEEIAGKHYNLSPNLYTKLERISLMPVRENLRRFMQLIDELEHRFPEDQLKDTVVQWRTMKAADSWNRAALTDLYETSGGVAKNRSAFGSGTPVAVTKDVIHHMFLPEKFNRYIEVSPGELRKYNIRRGDILMNRTSETIEELACCSVAAEDSPAVFGSYIKRLRLRKDGLLDPFYMAGYFQCAVYRRDVKRVSPVYTTRANMNMEMLSAIPVYYPGVTMQGLIGQTLYSVFKYRRTCQDVELSEALAEFTRLLIEQHITYPIASSAYEGCDDL